MNYLFKKDDYEKRKNVPTDDIFYADIKNSTMIRKIAFDKADSRLFVEFMGGAKYSYSDVKLVTVERMLTSKSPGRFFNREIKVTHKCNKITFIPEYLKKWHE